MNSRFSQFFSHLEEEPTLSSRWLSSGSQSLKTSPKPPFVLTMPPPNANGELHLGHVFGYVTMDILGRFYRANGHPVLLLPGKDHAGIQTQVVYEKKLAAEKVDTTTLSRADLYERCYAFCMDRANYMRSQEQSIGISADWSKELFTLDDRLNDVIFETFEKLWKDGLVYRGNRIVNWSVFSQTAISDVEVEYAEQKGSLWYIQYLWEHSPTPSTSPSVEGVSPLIATGTDARFLGSPPTSLKIGAVLLIDEQTWIVQECFSSRVATEEFIKAKAWSMALPLGQESFALLLPLFDTAKGLITATTRPETLLGDAALTVHPDDIRYKNFIGRNVFVPIINRAIPVVASTRIDPYFGTGVVKVTPAHDFLDYEIGIEHNLPIISVIGKDGIMTEDAGVYAGLPSLKCRAALVEHITNHHQLIDTKEIKHKVPISERGKDVIEPLISEQWWVAVDKPGNSLKDKALSLVRDGKLKIYPDNFTHQVIQWFENLKDWNISRQLWWGHQIPVWYKDGETVVSKTSPGAGFVQETDTFDTWFSSGQWPFSTLTAHGLIDREKEHKGFFPTHSMVMGRDILFFWACRMILLAAYRYNDVPFKHLYFHGLIRDEKGQKMSKSKGNGIEPKEILQKFGADALRLGMIVGTAPGIDLKLSPKKIEGYSKFINKLWNAAKLIELRLSELPERAPTTPMLDTSIWILNEIKEIKCQVAERISAYGIPQAADLAYEFVWFTFCDWYLEMMKSLASSSDDDVKAEVKWVTEIAFREVLILLHPFVPFITEAIYQRLPQIKTTELLADAPWITTELGNVAASSELKQMMNMITAVRSVKAAVGLPLQSLPAALPDASTFKAEHKNLLKDLGRLTLVSLAAIPEEEKLRKPFSGGEIFLQFGQKAQYHEKLRKDLEDGEKRLIALETKLNSDFALRAEPEVVAEERKKHSDLLNLLDGIRRELQ